MMQIIREYLHFALTDERDHGGEHLARPGLNLVYAAEEESDLAYMEALQSLARQHPTHFRVYTILNAPPLGWTEGVGFVKPSTLRKRLFFPPADDQLVVICGPPVFEKIMCKTLAQVGFQPHQWFSYNEDDEAQTQIQSAL